MYLNMFNYCFTITFHSILISHTQRPFNILGLAV